MYYYLILTFHQKMEIGKEMSSSKTVQITVIKTITVIDYKKKSHQPGYKVTKQPGGYSLVRIKNPFGMKGQGDWWVFAGTTHGGLILAIGMNPYIKFKKE